MIRILPFALLLMHAIRSAAQPCTPTTTFGPDGGSFVARVQFGGVFAIDHTTTFDPGISYQDYTYSGPDRWARVQPGATVPLSITAGSFAGTDHAVWIDLDGDDDFEPQELVAEQVSTSAGQVMTFSVTIPLQSLKLVTRMRVRAAFNMAFADPCANFLYGETEDYLVVIDDLAPCVPFATYGTTEGDEITALNLAGTVINTTSQEAAYVNADYAGVQLDINGAYSFSVTSGAYAQDRIAAWVDWDGSGVLGDDPSELLGTAITSAPFETVTFPFLVPTQLNVEPRQVRIRIRLWYGAPVGPCDDVSFGQTFDLTAAIQVPSCPCLPLANTFINRLPIGAVDIDGFSYANGVNVYPYYAMDFTPGPALDQGSSHTLTVGTTTLLPNTRVHVWLDANADLDFSDAGEYVGSVLSGPGGGPVSIPFTVPSSCPVGHTFLRIRTTSASLVSLTDGCDDTGIPQLGELKDLRLTIEDPAGPCIPRNTQWTLYGDVVDGVELNTLSNTGTGAQFGTEYNDYTALTTPLTIGSSHTVSVTSGNSSPNGLGVWIDWNDDQDFDDADEAIGQTITSAPNATFSTTFTVPAVTPGPRRMRVRCWYGTLPSTACAGGSWGETEDYTVEVQVGTALVETAFPEPLLKPSADGTGLELLTDAPWSGGGYQVLDASGRLVRTGRITGGTTAIPCNGLATGVLSVRLTLRDRTWTGRSLWSGH